MINSRSSSGGSLSAVGLSMYIVCGSAVVVAVAVVVVVVSVGLLFLHVLDFCY